MSGFWILPSRGRAETKLPRFLKAAVAAGLSTPGVIVVNEADYAQNHEAYDALEMPDGWSLLLTKHDTATTKTDFAWRELKATHPDSAWFGWLSDDSVPETPGWDQALIASLNGWNFVSCDDRMTAPAKCGTCVVFSAALLDAWDFFCLPGVNHMFSDDAWEKIGKATQCWTIDLNVIVRHEHAFKSGVLDDTTKRTNAEWPHDTKVWERWQRDGFQGAVERTQDLQRRMGLDLTTPDLSGVSLMIATPVGSGRVETEFVDGLMDTMNLLRAYGADVHWAKIRGSSDLVLSRCQLFSAFLRSEDTHLLWIDDDMKWDARDVVRLLLAKQDFIAAAGPRKSFPPSFAVNNSDPSGQTQAIFSDASAGLIEVTGVGMAFTLMTHHCALRMSQSYADLTFSGPNGASDYGVFLPLTHNGRYYGEDMAFCHRWRQIGGKVMVAPHISLGHWGSFRWEGAWLELLLAEAGKERRAA